MADETPKIPNSAIAPFALRMQPDVKAALEEAAAANGRSLNAEIVARLEHSLARENVIDDLETAHGIELTHHRAQIEMLEVSLERLEARMDEMGTWVRQALGFGSHPPDDSGLKARLEAQQNDFFSDQLSFVALLPKDEQAEALEQVITDMRRRYPGWEPPADFTVPEYVEPPTPDRRKRRKE